jgi:hypothetical protein
MAAAIGALAVAGLVGMAPIAAAGPTATPGGTTAHPCGGLGHTTPPTPPTAGPKATAGDHPLWLDTWRR